MFKPSFLLTCLYVMAYLALRGYGEIIYQSGYSQSLTGPVRQYTVRADPSLPRWKRQLYRAFFSAAMVVEEEGRRAASEGRGLVNEAGDYGRDLLREH